MLILNIIVVGYHVVSHRYTLYPSHSFGIQGSPFSQSNQIPTTFVHLNVTMGIRLERPRRARGRGGTDWSIRHVIGPLDSSMLNVSLHFLSIFHRLFSFLVFG